MSALYNCRTLCALDRRSFIVAKHAKGSFSISHVDVTRKPFSPLSFRPPNSIGQRICCNFFIAVCVFTAKHAVGSSLADYCWFFSSFDSRVIAQTTVHTRNKLTREINHIAIEGKKQRRYVLISPEPNGTDQTPLCMRCLVNVCKFICNVFQFCDLKKITNCLLFSLHAQSTR